MQWLDRAELRDGVRILTELGDSPPIFSTPCLLTQTACNYLATINDHPMSPNVGPGFLRDQTSTDFPEDEEGNVPKMMVDLIHIIIGRHLHWYHLTSLFYAA